MGDNYGSTKITTQQKKYLFKKSGIKNITDINVSILKQLKENLKSLKDTRQQSKFTYKLFEALLKHFYNLNKKMLGTNFLYLLHHI